MSRLQNRVILIGYVGNDPEMHSFASGDKKATFRLATNRYSKDAKGDSVEETDWHTVVVYGRLTEVVENFVHKGRRIGIEGRISYRSYSAQDGTKRFITEIVCDELELLGTGQGKNIPAMEESL